MALVTSTHGDAPQKTEVRRRGTRGETPVHPSPLAPHSSQGTVGHWQHQVGPHPGLFVPPGGGKEERQGQVAAREGSKSCPAGTTLLGPVRPPGESARLSPILPWCP